MPATAKNLLVVVPALNEERSVGVVVRDIRSAVPDAECLVVDDGSSDATARVAREAGARVLSLPFNLGVGGAMRAGFRYARENGHDVVVQVDADGQHDARYIPELVSGLSRADIVIGARFAGQGDYGVRGPRRWAMKVLARAVSAVSHEQLTDVTSGFKASGPTAVRLFAHTYPAEYLGDTVEALVIAARAGLRITQIPVAMRQRQSGEPSHNPVRASIYLVRACVAFLLALVRRRVDIRQEVTPSAVTYAFGIIVAILALVAIIELMRRVTLRERHAVWWLVGGVIALIVAIFPQTLTWAAHLLGFAVPTNLAFFLAIGLLFLVSLQYGAELTRIEDRMRSLAEQTAFQEERLRVVEDQLREASALSDGGRTDTAPAEEPAVPPESTPDASA